MNARLEVQNSVPIVAPSCHRWFMVGQKLTNIHASGNSSTLSLHSARTHRPTHPRLVLPTGQRIWPHCGQRVVRAFRFAIQGVFRLKLLDKWQYLSRLPKAWWFLPWRGVASKAW